MRGGAHLPPRRAAAKGRLRDRAINQSIDDGAKTGAKDRTSYRTEIKPGGTFPE